MKNFISHPVRDSDQTENFFSVVITTRNRAVLLTRALKSLIAQSEKSWEAIIVDDGSTDDTCAHVMPYLRSSQRIRYLWKPHSGNALSRNAGIRLAEGRFVTFLDSDDEYAKDHLERRKKFLIAHPAVRFLHGGVKIIGSPYVPDKDDHYRMVHLKDCVIGGSFIIAREAARWLNGFRKILLGSDADLFERAGQANISMAKISNPTYIYHHENPDSITNKMLKKVAS